MRNIRFPSLSVFENPDIARHPSIHLGRATRVVQSLCKQRDYLGMD